MLTRRIDDAFEALFACRSRVPPLRDLYLADAPERAALDDLLAALARVDRALFGDQGSRAAEPAGAPYPGRALASLD